MPDAPPPRPHTPCYTLQRKEGDHNKRADYRRSGANKKPPHIVDPIHSHLFFGWELLVTFFTLYNTTAQFVLVAFSRSSRVLADPQFTKPPGSDGLEGRDEKRREEKRRGEKSRTHHHQL